MHSQMLPAASALFLERLIRRVYKCLFFHIGGEKTKSSPGCGKCWRRLNVCRAEVIRSGGDGLLRHGGLPSMQFTSQWAGTEHPVPADSCSGRGLEPGPLGFTGRIAAARRGNPPEKRGGRSCWDEIVRLSLPASRPQREVMEPD